MEAVRKAITEEDLLALDPDARVEIIDGEWVQLSPVGLIHHVIVMNILRLLDRYALENGTGYVYPDGLIYLLHGEGVGLKGALVPDVSYIRNENIPQGWNFERPLPGAPDLAVEVMSPDDKAEVILIKTRRYLEAGTEQVWVVYPDSRELHQYRREDAANTVRAYRDDDTVDVEALFPGLALRITDVFRLPPWAEARQKPANE